MIRVEGPLPSSTSSVQRYRGKRPDESDRDYRIAMGWDAEPAVALSFHPFPQVQPPGGKELLLITTSKVFRKGDLYGGKQWRTDSDGWSATQGKYVYVLNNLSDVIYWAELPDAVALVNNVLRQVAHSSQAQGELSVNPGVTNNGRMNEENQNG